MALVTGASSGIGSACAISLGTAGAHVVVNVHSDGDGARHSAAKGGVLVGTDIHREVWASENGRRNILEEVPLGRIGMPGGAAKAVLWRASDDSGYVDGQALYIDGGMSLYPEFREGG